jgi:hypothetical protein
VLIARGLPAVMSQTFRTLIHSRLEVGLSRYAARFPDADIVLLEPRSDEYALFFANLFSFRSRVAICERGYAATRRDLLERYTEIAPIVESHGFSLRADVLLDETRDLWRDIGLEVGTRRKSDASPRVMESLDRALDEIERGLVNAAEAAADDRPAAR